MLAGLLAGAVAPVVAQGRTVVLVTAELAHAPPPLLEREVCRPIEEALRGLDPGLRSACGEGRVRVCVECGLGRTEAANAVAARLRDVDLPGAATVELEAERGPVACRVVVDGQAALADLSAAAIALARRIERAPGVDAVEVDGTAPVRALVELDPERLRARDLDPGSVADAVRDALAAAPCNEVGELDVLLVARDVQLRDVARSYLDARPGSPVRSGAGAAVLLTVRVRGGERTEAARAALAEGMRDLPAQLRATLVPDDAVAVEVTGPRSVREAAFALAGRLDEHDGIEAVVAVAGDRDPDLGVAMPERGTLWITEKGVALAATLATAAPAGLSWRIVGEGSCGVVEILADDRERVLNAPAVLRAELLGIPGIAAVSLGAPPERTRVAVDPDPERLAAAGLTPAAFARAVELLGRGSVAGSLSGGIHVTVRVGPARDDWWRDATVRTGDGWRPLPSLAAVVARAQPVVLYRVAGRPATRLIVDAAGGDRAKLQARLHEWCAAERPDIVLRWIAR